MIIGTGSNTLAELGATATAPPRAIATDGFDGLRRFAAETLDAQARGGLSRPVSFALDAYSKRSASTGLSRAALRAG